MSIKTFFAPEVDIRLTEDLNGFVCTVQRRFFGEETTEFTLDPHRDFSPEPCPHSVRRNPFYRVVLRPQQKDPPS